MIRSLTDSSVILVDNIDKAIEVAKSQQSLVAALTYLAIWENDRAVKQARENPQWETCFGSTFQRYFDAVEIEKSAEDSILDPTALKIQAHVESDMHMYGDCDNGGPPLGEL